MLGLTCLGYDLVLGAITGAWLGIEFWMLVLIAKYAATFRITPRPRGQILPNEAG